MFSLHIHDGDLWMYVLYVDGQVVDQFNPIPGYWEDGISQQERDSWKGNAETVVKYVSGLNPHDSNKYLVSWLLEDEERIKAHPNDEYPQEDWQLLDFMRKLKLPYPLDDNFKATGNTYRLWTKEMKIEPQKEKRVEKPNRVIPTKIQKPWWKLW